MDWLADFCRIYPLRRWWWAEKPRLMAFPVEVFDIDKASPQFASNPWR